MARSDVWDFFQKIESANKAKCNSCLKDFAYRGGTTTNLREHIVLKHSDIYAPKRKGNSTTTKETKMEDFSKRLVCSEQ